MLRQVSAPVSILAAVNRAAWALPKLCCEYREETFLDRLIGLFAARCSPVIVVLGAAADRIRAGAHPAATFVAEPGLARGQTTSMQCGLRAVPPDADGVLFTLVDHPAVRPATIDACWPGRVPRWCACRAATGVAAIPSGSRAG